MDNNAIIQAAVTKVSEKITQGDILDVIRSLLDKNIDNIRQNMAGLVDTNAKSILKKFVDNLQRRLISACQTWAGLQTDSNVPILPANIKYYTKIGNKTVFVIEHMPQVRHLFFSDLLLNGIPAETSPENKKGKPRLVSLPYLIFTVTFKNKICFESLRLNVRTKPLCNIDDKLYFPNLPNIQTCDSVVCFGSIYNQNVLDELMRLPIAAQIDKVITSFYESVFNMDYHSYYEDMTNREPRLRTLSHWIKHSAIDPAFILNVNFFPHCTLRELVSRAADNRQAISTSGLSNAFCLETEAELVDVASHIEHWLSESVCECKLGPFNIGKDLVTKFSNIVNQACTEIIIKLEQDEKLCRV